MALGAVAAATVPAHAAYTVTAEEVGDDVVFTGSGTIDLTALTYDRSFGAAATLLRPDFGIFGVGLSPVDRYYGVSGPESFGPGGATVFADSTTGGKVHINGRSDFILVPTGYVSGSDLGTSTSVFEASTFASLGLTEGTYTWTWGEGTANADSFTLNIGAPVPEASAWAMMILGLGFAGAALRRRSANVTVTFA